MSLLHVFIRVENEEYEPQTIQPLEINYIKVPTAEDTHHPAGSINIIQSVLGKP